MAAHRLLTIADLNERWQLEPGSGIVMEHVHRGTLKLVDLSPAGVKRSGQGAKTIRFRLADVEAFEAARTRAFDEADRPAAPAPVAAGSGGGASAVPGWDGKVRGGKGGGTK